MKALKVICVFMCFVMLLSFTVSAQEKSANLVLPSSFVNVNETFSVALTTTAEEPFFAHSFKIEFDSTAVQLLTTENCNILRDGVARVAFSCSSTNTVTTQLQFKVLNRKDVVFKISEITVSDGNEEYYFDDISATFNNSQAKKGDLDLNGEIDVVDLALLKKEVSGISQINDEYISDYDSNGTVDVVDLALLKKFIAGL